MRIVLQRSKDASVKVNNKVVGKIDFGLLLLVGFTDKDSSYEIDYMVDKVINLRVFDDENGVMNKSLLDVEGSILSISQFTLYGDTKKGNRPSYIRALRGEESIKLYDLFNSKLSEFIHVETGQFGADMEVSLINDGPVTIILEKENI
jgi:D-tyrosyl-tRNA(Tyr) deacylase